MANKLYKSAEAVLIALLILFFPFSRAFSQTNGGPTVQWYEPKVVPTTKPGINKVTLMGKTDSFIIVQVNPENIIVIQRQDANSAFQPKVAQKEVRSNDKGNFSLSLFVPSGLLQVPIEFKQPGSANATPILLTMRNDPKDVSLNVKVIRPTKTKIVKVAPKAVSSFSFGWSPLMLQQSADIDNTGEIKNNETAAMSARLEGSRKYDKWWWLAYYEYAKANESPLQSFSLESRYRLTSSELWLDASLDGRSLPLLVRDDNGVLSRVNTQFYRAALGFTYLASLQDMSILGSLYYHVPVAVKVDGGEIVVTSPVAVSLNTRMIFHFEKPWSFVLGLNAEYNSFQYEYRNTPALIGNEGKAQNMILEALALIQYEL